MKTIESDSFFECVNSHRMTLIQYTCPSPESWFRALQTFFRPYIFFISSSDFGNFFHLYFTIFLKKHSKYTLSRAIYMDDRFLGILKIE